MQNQLAPLDNESCARHKRTRCPCMSGELCNNKTRQCLCKFCSRRKKERKIFSFSPEALHSKNIFQLYLRSRTVTLGSFGGFSCLKFSRNAAEISEFFWFYRLDVVKVNAELPINLWINAIVAARQGKALQLRRSVVAKKKVKVSQERKNVKKLSHSSLVGHKSLPPRLRVNFAKTKSQIASTETRSMWNECEV